MDLKSPSTHTASETPSSPLLQNPKSATPHNPFLQNSDTDPQPKEDETTSSEDPSQQQDSKSFPDPPVDSKPPESFRALFFQYWQEAISYCAVFWTFGMCVAFLGPTLLDIG